MALSAGTRIGVYEIIDLLGAGGMGEVYRARDTRLGRDVAIKVLPDAYALDAERLARFTREAQVLASLNHPNIAIVHGFEQASIETGSSGETKAYALVMELVDGPTLAERIAQGRIPVDEAVAIARQIAEALDAAHEQGILHRDLKPANIKVRENGTVKVLDFGLAKMLETETRPASSLSLSPTITTPAMTQLGVILGTAAYMAPEQARGKSADKRSDVWAFGCVLFEMLAAAKAFDGEDATDTIAAVVRGEPPWSALPSDVPPAIRLLLQRCLEKDRRKRIGSASAVLFVLNEPSLLSTPAAALPPSRDVPHARWRTIAWSTLAVVAVGAMSAGAVWTSMRPVQPRVSRLALITSGSTTLARGINGQHLTIAPDGSHVVYVGAAGGPPVIYARALDSIEPLALVQGGTTPFVRPDSRWVGFFGQGMLSRVAMTGGPAAEIARIDGPARGATWGDDGTIVFATAGSHRGLQRVSAAGGEPQVLTRPAPGEIEHVLPQFLPGARAVLFTIRRPGAPTSQVAILDLRAESPTPKILIRGGSDARYLPTGHLVYVAGDSLRVVPFDLSRLEIPDATSVPVAANIAVLGGVAGEYDVAADGTLVYLDAVGGSSAARTLVWVDRSGREQPIAAPPRAYLYPRLSPDGTRVALDVREQETDIWVWDLVRNGFTRVTKDPNLDRAPVWTADGDYIVFSGMTDGTPNVYLQRADGAGTPERITQTRRPQFPLSLSPDGSQVVLADTGETVERADLTIVRLDPSRGRDGGSAKPVEAEPLVRTPAGELNGAISPDGRWLAYQSNESGDWDVYVRPFANGRASSGIRSTVSTAGGIQPRWSHDGHELFYISRSNEMMRVHVTAGPTWSASTPQKLFDVSPYYFGAGNPYFMYDIARDGRFLMVKAPGAAKTDTSSEDHIILVQNWLEEVKRAMQAR